MGRKDRVCPTSSDGIPVACRRSMPSRSRHTLHNLGVRVRCGSGVSMPPLCDDTAPLCVPYGMAQEVTMPTGKSMLLTHWRAEAGKTGMPPIWAEARPTRVQAVELARAMLDLSRDNADRLLRTGQYDFDRGGYVRVVRCNGDDVFHERCVHTVGFFYTREYEFAKVSRKNPNHRGKKQYARTGRFHLEVHSA